MCYAELYNSLKEYYFQDGKIASYEAIKELFPLVDTVPFIVFTDYKRKIIISMMMLDLQRTEYDIPAEYSDLEAVNAIVAKINNQPDPGVEDTTRIADALEDLVVLNMPDEEVE